MDDDTFHQCLAITKDIRSQPLSVLFREPFKSDKNTMKEYLSQISKPMDLQTVQETLEAKGYPNFKSWANDMDLIFENAIKYNNSESLVGGIAIYLRKIVQKKIFEMKVTMYDDIYNIVLVKYLKKIENISKEIDKIGSGKRNSKNNKEQDESLLIVEKLDWLKDKLNNIAESGNSDKIIEELNKCDLDLCDNEDIDLAKMNRKTIDSLIKFVEQFK